MYCVICLDSKETEEKTKVEESRKYGDTVYRRRRCLTCGKVFYTKEKEVDNTGIKYLWSEIQRERREKNGKQENSAL